MSLRTLGTTLAALAVGAFAAVGGAADATGLAAGGTPSPIDGRVQAFVAARCLACHDDATRESGVSLQSLGTSVTAATAAGWLRALEQIERGTMPPPDAEQPSAADRQAATLALEQAVVAHAQSKPARDTAVLRRLNRTEYRRTLEELLQLDLSGRDPTRDFPDDTLSHGFASDGGKLVTSNFLLRQYLAAAKDVVGRAVHFEPQPDNRTRAFDPPLDGASWGIRYAESEMAAAKSRWATPFSTLDLRGAAMSLTRMREGVPVAGWYSIRVLAEAKFRHGDMDPRKIYDKSLFDPAQPLRLSLTLGSLVGIDPANGDAIWYEFIGTKSRGVASPPVAVWDVPDDVPTWLECRVWLEPGQFPKFEYVNGPGNSDYRMDRYIAENRYTLLDKKQLADFEEADKPFGWATPIFFETPRIRVHKAEVKGPLNEQWPPASHHAIFGDTPYDSAAAGEVLRSFAERAWRRPVTAEDVAPILDLVRATEEAAVKAGTPTGQAAQEAIVEGIQAVLCAPEFLYREERGDGLDGHEIAARLSYFLWSAPPDAGLLAHAAANDLVRPEVRRQEAERLLDDPRSDTFANEFLDGWLQLRKLGSMAPSGFEVYYNDKLEPAMRKETRLYFKHLLQTNGPIADLLDSDYTFVNRALAKHYRLDWKTAEADLGKPVDGLTADDLRNDAAGRAPSQNFVRVKLADRRRGGVLGQASVLTLTANGVDTSPVVRGAWVLENILGAPPSPPPPNVPVVEPDVRGKTTIRDRLQAHRDNSACSSCHRHIDPPGFALESFDAIGTFRSNYYYPAIDKSLPVDPSGEFDGASFKDVAGFKDQLLKRQPQFARCLVEKLLIHMLGRDVTAADRPAIRSIVDRAAADGFRLRDLVLLCCESDLLVQK
jgi:hypothetical protein